MHAALVVVFGGVVVEVVGFGAVVVVVVVRGAVVVVVLGAVVAGVVREVLDDDVVDGVGLLVDVREVEVEIGVGVV